MNATVRDKLNKSKRRIDRRLDRTKLGDCDRPQFTASNIHYEIGGRTRGLSHDGIGLPVTNLTRGASRPPIEAWRASAASALSYKG